MVSVGPGDPQLLTFAAVHAIERADVVAFPVVRANAESMAAAVVQPWMHPRQRRLPLIFPMVEAAGPRRTAWHEAADVLAGEVRAARSVVLLCEGDASLFATSSYVLLALQQRHPNCPVRVIPGVTSVSAAAAAAAWPLALQKDQLLLRPCPDRAEELEVTLEDAARQSRVLALLKLGRRWAWVQPLLEQRGLLREALFAERVGWAEQRICPASEMKAEERPYFSLLLIRQDWPEVLP